MLFFVGVAGNCREVYSQSSKTIILLDNKSICVENGSFNKIICFIMHKLFQNAVMTFKSH